MATENPYWGDFHNNIHHSLLARIDEIFAAAREHLDFLPIAYYPWEGGLLEGMRVELQLDAAVAARDWRVVEDACRRFNEPGRFVTFPGYEWHGDRARWGDHNVFYPREGFPLDDTRDIADLSAKLRERGGIAIPHHTAYRRAIRGKDWDHYDPATMPVVEVYSSHGSSEGVGTPVEMHSNSNMGPRTSGGAWLDGLARGYRLGAIASTDAHGDFAGAWGLGLAGVWAPELTREAVWEAVVSRRTFAVTRDRIEVNMTAAGAPMGSEAAASGPVVIEVWARGLDAVDRIELIRDGVPVRTHVASKLWQVRRYAPGDVVRARLRVQCGWGPPRAYNFPDMEFEWDCRLALSDGRILGIAPCWTSIGQHIESVADREAIWKLATRTRDDSARRSVSEAVVVEVEAPAAAKLAFETRGRRLEFALAEALAGSRVETFADEGRKLIRDTFGLDPERVPDVERISYVSPRVKIARAVPSEAYELKAEFRDEDAGPGEHYYYARVFQTQGDCAWTSPVWLRTS